MGGWIKIYSKFLQWEWFDKAEMVQLFIYLLLRANYKDMPWRGIPVRRGQLLTSRDKISKETGLTERRVRTCISRLLTTNEISVKTTNKYSIITICKYEKYQDDLQGERPANDQQSDQQTTGRATTSKEYKNIISSSSSSARAREDEEKKLIEGIKDDSGWCGAVARLYGLGAEEVSGWIDGFALVMRCRGETHKDLPDAKRHFNDWLRLQLKEKRKEKEKSEKENERRKKGEFERQKYAAKRGNLKVTAKSGDDYKTTF